MKNIFLGLLSIILISSCADEELGPILTFDNATIGSYIRLVQLNTGEFDLDNASTSALDYEVDFVDKENGSLVDEYILEVQFFDNTPGNGDNSIAKTQYKVFDKSQFSTSSNGNQGVRVMIPLSDVMSSLGLTMDQVSASDNFAFFGSVNQGGTVYSSANSTSTVRGSAFKGYFDFNGKLTCPQSDDKFVGTYTLSYEGDAGLGYGVPYESGSTVEVTAVPGSSTLREFSSIILPGIGGYGPYTTRFDLVCDKAVFELMTADGLGCISGNSIMFGPALDENKIAIGGDIDLADDSVIKLVLNEGLGNGGCAGQTGETATVLVLTK